MTPFSTMMISGRPGHSVACVRPRRAVFQALHETGAEVLLGTDSPQLLGVSGFSNHREMDLRMELGGAPGMGGTPSPSTGTPTPRSSSPDGALQGKGTNRESRSLLALFVAGLVAMGIFLGGCGAPPPDTLGPTDDGLPSCPDAPNCVHTGDGHPPDVPPFHLTAEWGERSPQAVWDAVERAVSSLQGTEVVERTDSYLHAEATSRVFRFVDDLEVYWVPESLELVVRSESRVGRSDLGVNMTRVERLRQALQAEGVVE